MKMISRRDCLGLLGTAAATGLVRPTLAAPLEPANMFAIPDGTTYLNGARLHPLSQASLTTIQSYLAQRALNPVPDDTYFDDMEGRVKKSFAKLINAKVDEVCFVQSTQVAENLLVTGLGLDLKSDNIVTDALHYRGSIYFYGEMAKKGFDVRLVKPNGNSVLLSDLSAAIDSHTKIVSISLVSYMNGFQHDLRAVCDVAHSKGALVYADIVQAAGAVPIDVKESGVDFCACSGYKWLMGDKGLGFLYVRSGLLDTRVKRTQFGGDQLKSYEDHIFAADPPLGAPATWAATPDAAGHFEVGSVADLVVASLINPLDYLNERGVVTIQQQRLPLMQKLMREVPKLGYRCLTPTPDTPIVSFAIEDRRGLAKKLKDRNITVSFIEHTMRVSPSIYNSEADIDRLLHALRA
jgi:selenocysteine lyase/cysteine desulfurase